MNFLEQIQHDFEAAHLRYYSRILNFSESVDFAKAPTVKVGQKITQKGGRVITCDPAKTYPCGNICRSQDKPCSKPLEGQAKSYVEFLKLQGSKKSETKKLIEEDKKPNTDWEKEAKQATKQLLAGAELTFESGDGRTITYKYNKKDGYTRAHIVATDSDGKVSKQAMTQADLESQIWGLYNPENQQKVKNSTPRIKEKIQGVLSKDDTLKNLLDGKEITISTKQGDATLKYVTDRQYGVNYLDITDGTGKKQQPMMTQEQLTNYVDDLFNPKLVKALGAANPRLSESKGEKDSETNESKFKKVGEKGFLIPKGGTKPEQIIDKKKENKAPLTEFESKFPEGYVNNDIYYKDIVNAKPGNIIKGIPTMKEAEILAVEPPSEKYPTGSILVRPTEKSKQQFPEGYWENKNWERFDLASVATEHRRISEKLKQDPFVSKKEDKNLNVDTKNQRKTVEKKAEIKDENGLTALQRNALEVTGSKDITPLQKISNNLKDDNEFHDYFLENHPDIYKDYYENRGFYIEKTARGQALATKWLREDINSGLLESKLNDKTGKKYQESDSIRVGNQVLHPSVRDNLNKDEIAELEALGKQHDAVSAQYKIKLRSNASDATKRKNDEAFKKLQAINTRAKQLIEKAGKPTYEKKELGTEKSEGVTPKSDEPDTSKTIYTPVKVGTKNVAINPEIHSKLTLDHDPVTGWRIRGADGALLREPKQADGRQETHRFKTKEAAENFAKKVSAKAESLVKKELEETQSKSESKPESKPLASYGVKGKTSPITDADKELDSFLSTPSKTVQMVYVTKDGVRQVDMGYLNPGKNKKDRTEQFRLAATRVSDNLDGTGKGYVKDTDGKLYEISRSTRSAKLISADDVKKGGLVEKPKNFSEFTWTRENIEYFKNHKPCTTALSYR